MTTTTFNPMTYADKLENAGMDSNQAKAQTEMIYEVYSGLKQDISGCRKDIDHCLQGIKSLDTKYELNNHKLEYKLTVKLGSMIAGSLGIIAALMTFFHFH